MAKIRTSTAAEANGLLPRSPANAGRLPPPAPWPCPVAFRGALNRRNVDTDAHMLDHLASMELGVLTARRAWVEPAGVVNTWPVTTLCTWAARHER